MPGMRQAEMTLRFGEAPGGGGVVIMSQALDLMLKYRQTLKNDPEAGGLLFGTFEGKETIIRDVTVPGILDRRTRTGFKPNRTLQRMHIITKYTRGLHLIGDWHTHPECCPHPSGIDITNSRDAFCKSKHDLKAMVTIIIGTGRPPHGIFVALIDKSEPRALTLIPG
jgi:integrative and conjugative element protein (TIGR02256 family)